MDLRPSFLPAVFSCVFLPTGIPTHHPRVYNIHSRNVTRYPANSIVVVGGCPVCRYVPGLGAPEATKDTLRAS